MNHKQLVEWFKKGLAEKADAFKDERDAWRELESKATARAAEAEANRVEMTALIMEIGPLARGRDDRVTAVAMRAADQAAKQAVKAMLQEEDPSVINFPMVPETEVVTDRQGRVRLDQETVLFSEPLGHVPPHDVNGRYDEDIFNVELAQLAFVDFGISHARLAIRMNVSETALRALLHATDVRTKRPQK